LAAAQAAGTPVVNVWLGSPIATEAPCVYANYHAAGRMVAEHLIARGLRRLAHFGYARDPASLQNSQGMREVAREHGYPFTHHLVSSHFSENRDQWIRFTAYVQKSQAVWEAPLGVGFIDDSLCRSVASACLVMEWSIPEQLALVGSGNNTLICNSIDPTLSTIDMGFHQCGYEAAKLLDRLMRGGTPPEEAQFTSPSQLVVRRSSDAFAVSDPKVAQALRFMADNVGDVHSVPSIAKSVGLGRQSLERRFNQHVGRTINEELIRFRVETLKRLLVESTESIKTLSIEAGFGTTVNMHTMFKRQTGMTPAMYRKKHSPRPERDELRS
ncbi:MAG: substrate-binding domain-containing protein, partial [Myxococcota bacterium]